MGGCGAAVSPGRRRSFCGVHYPGTSFITQVQPLLAAVQGAFLAQLAAWLLYGELLPSPPGAEEDFFVCCGDGGDADDADSDSDAAPHKVGCRADGGGSGGGGSGGGGGGGGRDEGYGVWWSYRLRVACKPRLLSVRTAEASLFVGKVVRVLSPLVERDATSAVGGAAAAGGSAGAAVAVGAAVTSSLSSLAVGRCGAVAGGEGAEEAEPPAARQLQWRLRELATELHELQAALPLDAAGARRLESTLDLLQHDASSLLWRHLGSGCGLRGLLRALKDYFLLGRGEVWHALVLHPLTMPRTLTMLHPLIRCGTRWSRSCALTSTRRHRRSSTCRRRCSTPPPACRPTPTSLSCGCGCDHPRPTTAPAPAPQSPPMAPAPAPVLPRPAARSPTMRGVGCHCSWRWRDLSCCCSTLATRGGATRTLPCENAIQDATQRTTQRTTHRTMQRTTHRTMQRTTHRNRYDELFGFLWLVKRVQTELQAVWASQTTTGAMSPPRRAALMPLWQLRAHMSFLVDNLQYYLQARHPRHPLHALHPLHPLRALRTLHTLHTHRMHRFM